MIATLILVLFLALSVLGNFGLLLGALFPMQTAPARHGTPRLQEITVEDNGARNKIALVEIEGIITSQLLDARHNMVDVLEARLERAAEDDHVVAVLLRVDSPGGEVLASDEMYRAIREFQERVGKPVVGCMGGLAASGGYYVSAPCDWIVANELTITGSIGVIMGSWNYRGLMDKVGLLPQTYKSGTHKDMLSGSRHPDDIPAEEREMIQSLIDEVYGKFKDIVRDGRETAFEINAGEGQSLVKDWVDYADGRIFSGTEAFKLGFVDEVGTLDDAVFRTLTMAGVQDADVVRYEHIPNISSLLRMFGESESRSIRVDLGMQFPDLEPGRLYFLSPTLLR